MKFQKNYYTVRGNYLLSDAKGRSIGEEKSATGIWTGKFGKSIFNYNIITTSIIENSNNVLSGNPLYRERNYLSCLEHSVRVLRSGETYLCSER